MLITDFSVLTRPSRSSFFRALITVSVLAPMAREISLRVIFFDIKSFFSRKCLWRKAIRRLSTSNCWSALSSCRYCILLWTQLLIMFKALGFLVQAVTYVSFGIKRTQDWVKAITDPGKYEELLLINKTPPNSPFERIATVDSELFIFKEILKLPESIKKQFWANSPWVKRTWPCAKLTIEANLKRSSLRSISKLRTSAIFFLRYDNSEASFLLKG